MRYLSTRDPRPSPATHTFEDVLLAGLAEDGGLFVPVRLPTLDLLPADYPLAKKLAAGER